MEDKPKRKRGRPKGSTKNAITKRVDKKLEKIDKKTDSPSVLSTSLTLSLIRQVEEMVLKGENAKDIKENLLIKGHKCSMQKIYRLIRIAKGNIKKRFDKDLETNYQWVVENLMDLHKKAVDDEDGRLRLMVIERFTKLAGLDVQKVEQVTLEVSKDDLEEIQKMFFG